jgi:hypothetical protein
MGIYFRHDVPVQPDYDYDWYHENEYNDDPDDEYLARELTKTEQRKDSTPWDVFRVYKEYIARVCDMGRNNFIVFDQLNRWTRFETGAACLFGMHEFPDYTMMFSERFYIDYPFEYNDFDDVVENCYGMIGDDYAREASRFYDYVLNRSPFNKLYPDTSSLDDIFYKGVKISLEYDARYTLAGGALMRYCDEHSDKIQYWNRLTAKGWTEDRALAMVHLTVMTNRDVDDVIWEPQGEGHGMICGNHLNRQNFFGLLKGEVNLTKKASKDGGKPTHCLNLFKDESYEEGPFKYPDGTIYYDYSKTDIFGNPLEHSLRGKPEDILNTLIGMNS